MLSWGPPNYWVLSGFPCSAAAVWERIRACKAPTGNTCQVLPQSTGWEQGEPGKAFLGLLVQRREAPDPWEWSTSKLTTSGPKP